jgi:hypothetical protein
MMPISRRRNAIGSGAYRRPFMFDTHENASVVGVHFRPGAAGVVLGVPPGELMDRHVDLEDIWGRRARELRERLCAATTTSERFAILEAELVSRPRSTRARAHPPDRGGQFTGTTSSRASPEMNTTASSRLVVIATGG